MAKSSGQKIKILYILRYLEKYTDEDNSISTQKIIDLLAEEGIECGRKTIYSDIESLKDMGYEIEMDATRNGGGWRLISREFELPEVKLLVDAVMSSKFITSKKSKELVTKLETLTSSRNAAMLNRQVYTKRIKTENESIFYVVDGLQNAIQNNKEISFRYLEWSPGKVLVTKGPDKRIVSPWALIWNDENYYLVAYDDEEKKSKHFRVDKMTNIEVLTTPRKGEKWFKKQDMVNYANNTFSMMGGELQSVTLDLPRTLVGVVIDRFGKDITIQKIDEERIRIHVQVHVSQQFYGWLTGLGDSCVIHSPEDVRTKYIDWLSNLTISNKNA